MTFLLHPGLITITRIETQNSLETTQPKATLDEILVWIKDHNPDYFSFEEYARRLYDHEYKKATYQKEKPFNIRLIKFAEETFSNLLSVLCVNELIEIISLEAVEKSLLLLPLFRKAYENGQPTPLFATRKELNDYQQS